ncbi:related to putative multidrug transporter [Cephalotrichum gorgonifer]|uniref:Related to putative multidrug transporter n=1 Tax=Cephalotrichum gorgonifer TaxID=2041049 RepID=A0AAE8SZ57_9PEZI|nr:related to putative multidrug transporter [Cephalotrichum gorgonifer]
MTRSSSPSTTSTAVAGDMTPLLSDSGSDATLRDGYGVEVRSGNGAARDGGGDVESESRGAGDDGITLVGRWRAIFISLSISILLFLQASNMSGMTLTQGIIAHDLNSYASPMWFTTAYLIAASALAPIIGRLATIFPPRTLVPPSATLLTLGSLFSSQSATFAQFVVSRVVMGLGAAGVMTLAVVFVLGLARESRRGFFIGLVNVCFTIGLSFGAVVFGAVEPVIGWRALFWIQAPISAAAGLGLYLSLPPSVGVSERTRSGTFREKILKIDYLGASMLTFSIVLFLYGLAGEIQVTPILTSLLALLVFLAVENFYATDPIIPLSVLSSRGALLSCAAQLGFLAARWTLLYYAPVFMLAAQGYSPAAAGSILIPTNFGFGSGGLLVGWLHIRRSGSFWLPSALSLALFAATMYVLSLVGHPDVSPAVMSFAVFLNGLATGAALNYTLAHILHLSHPGTEFVTTSLMGTVRGFGGSFGTAIGGGVFYRVLKRGLEEGYAALDGGGGLSREREELVRRLLGSPAYVFGGGLSGEERDVAIEGYAGASRWTWKMAAAMGVVVAVVQLGTGWTSPKERKEREAGDAEARARLMENEGVGEA